MSKTLSLIFFILGLSLALRFMTFFTAQTAYIDGQILTFETKINGASKITSKGQSLTIDLPNGKRSYAILGSYPELNYGDSVKISGKITYFKGSQGSKVAFLRYPKFELIEKGIESNLLLSLRQKIVGFFETSLPQTDSSLMLGIVFGIKEEFPQHFAENIKNTGLLHVIAASGMNITMVGGFLSSLFAYFFKRQIALVLSIGGILLYAFLAGFEPSIVRASIMGILVFSAQIMGRQTLSFLSLIFAGWAMLMIKPNLITDIGFQLSFMATAGLITFRPLFYKKKKIKHVIEKSIIGEDLVTTVTAQIFTLPILLTTFGAYSLWSILVNALVLWTVPPLMIIGAVAALLGIIASQTGTIVLLLAKPLLAYFEFMVNLFGSAGGLISLQNLPPTITLVYYLILTAVIIRFRK